MPEYLSVCTVQIDNVCVCVCKRERERVSRSYCSGILVDFHALSFSRITKKKMKIFLMRYSTIPR